MNKNIPGRIGIVILTVLLAAGCGKKEQTTTTTLGAEVPRADAPLIARGLVNVRSLDPFIRVELRYSTTNNFLGKDVYGELSNCFLQPETAAMLTNAQAILAARRPGYSLLVYDGARPANIQQKMFDLVKGTSLEIYVANPAKGSLHNYGCAVDLTIAGPDGVPLDMGSPFDSFEDISQPRYENDFVAIGILKVSQAQNRQLLRDVMGAAGFSSIRSEWWHFDTCSIDEAKQKYEIIP